MTRRDLFRRLCAGLMAGFVPLRPSWIGMDLAHGPDRSNEIMLLRVELLIKMEDFRARMRILVRDALQSMTPDQRRAMRERYERLIGPLVNAERNECHREP